MVDRIITFVLITGTLTRCVRKSTFDWHSFLTSTSVVDIVILICVGPHRTYFNAANAHARFQFVAMPDNLVYLAIFNFINNRESVIPPSQVRPRAILIAFMQSTSTRFWLCE